MKKTVPIRALAGLVGSLVLTTGCLSITPYSEVRGRLPAASLIEVERHSAHVEQAGSGPALAMRYRTVAMKFRHQEGVGKV